MFQLPSPKLSFVTCLLKCFQMRGEINNFDTGVHQLCYGFQRALMGPFVSRKHQSNHFGNYTGHNHIPRVPDSLVQLAKSVCQMTVWCYTFFVLLGKKDALKSRRRNIDSMWTTSVQFIWKFGCYFERLISISIIQKSPWRHLWWNMAALTGKPCSVHPLLGVAISWKELLLFLP